MFSTVADACLLIIGVVLPAGAVSKLAAAAGSGAAHSRLGPVALVPEHLRRSTLVVLAGIEVLLAAGLFVTHPITHWAAVAFFAISAYVLWDLRGRRPDVGCGCFGDVSVTPVGRRAISRTAVLT